MKTEVFSRYENKFLISVSAASYIQEKILEHMELDEYSRKREFYPIYNIYFDSKDNYLIRNSLCKPKYKEKLRMRSYEIPGQDSMVYMEIKKKFCGLVNKRRTMMTLNEAQQFIATKIRPEIKEYMNRQVINEIAYFLEFYDPEPKLFLAYDRKAFHDPDDGGLRITFDRNIRTRRYDLGLEQGDYGEELLDPGQLLMEIKTQNNFPLWLSRLLSECSVFSSGFSKYGTEYQLYIANSRTAEGEKEPCSTHYSAQHRLNRQYL
jgi:hypothetical protein